MIKKGVKLHPATVWSVAMPIIFQIYTDFGVTPVITSGMDGKHMPGSLHFGGLAFDFRTRHVGAAELPQLVAQITEALGDEFDVVLESDHLHVEFDP